VIVFELGVGSCFSMLKNGFMIFKRTSELTSPLATLFYDYYDSEEHINEVFLPKLNGDTPKEPLYVGFFHTGAYQDQISGYGGIKHCMIPSPKHVTEWTKHYGEISMSTSIPLAWIKSIEVKKYRTEELHRCLFDPQVTITTVNNVTFQSEYKRLEWIRQDPSWSGKPDCLHSL